jgi:hypothetical protein
VSACLQEPDDDDDVYVAPVERHWAVDEASESVFVCDVDPAMEGLTSTCLVADFASGTWIRENESKKIFIKQKFNIFL